MIATLPDDFQVYVDDTNINDPSLGIIQNLMKTTSQEDEFVNHLARDRASADMVLTSPILTPNSFEQFLSDFIMQLQQLQNSQAEEISA